jgi:hypothetical protein
LNDNKKQKIGINEVKKALSDAKFRDKLPLEIRDDVAKYLYCPTCKTSDEICQKVLNVCQNQLSEYYSKRIIGLMDVKQALKDDRFRKNLPTDMQAELEKYSHCPSCASNINLYRQILKECTQQLLEYFPGTTILDEAKEIETLAQNHWTVFSCHINELENKLRSLPKGRKQVAITRYEDQITAVINELDVIF